MLASSLSDSGLVVASLPSSALTLLRARQSRVASTLVASCEREGVGRERRDESADSPVFAPRCSPRDPRPPESGSCRICTIQSSKKKRMHIQSSATAAAHSVLRAPACSLRAPACSLRSWSTPFIARYIARALSRESVQRAGVSEPESSPRTPSRPIPPHPPHPTQPRPGRHRNRANYDPK